MLRRTLPRHRALLTLAAQPWTLYEDDPNAGGGGGGGAPSVNEHGYPDATPIADMSPEHQAAYWKHQSRKHEARANTAPDAAELQRLKDRDAALKKLEDDQLSDTQRLQGERDTATQERDTANATVTTLTDENLRLKIALEKGLTLAQVRRLTGSTKEELEADADEYLKELGATGSQGGYNGAGSRSGGARGSDVGGTSSVTSGAERYRQRHGKQ